MLYFIDTPDAIRVTSDFDEASRIKQGFTGTVYSRHDFQSMEDAQAMADRLNEQAGEMLYIATDAGRSSWPQFDVITAPRVGDEVSSAFNGDYYPEGRIVKISDSLRRIETDTGVIYWRKKQSGRWVASKTWSMVRGHVERRNPSF